MTEGAAGLIAGVTERLSRLLDGPPALSDFSLAAPPWQVAASIR